MRQFAERVRHIFKKEVKEPVLHEKEEFKQDVQKSISEHTTTLRSFLQRLMALLNGKGFKLTAAVVLLLFIFYSNDFSNEFLMLGVFVGYGLLLFLLKIDSRYSIGAALVLLIAVPIYLINHREVFANYLATLAYFFLVVGVIKQFVEYLRERKGEKVE